MDFKKRKKLRLNNFDYSNPYAYFVTVCCNERKKIFVEDELNIDVINCLLEERKRTRIKILAYCLMPDHLHFIIIPTEGESSVPDFVGAFKSRSANNLRKKYMLGHSPWQKSFYDHVIRKSEDLDSIVKYILNNPLRKNIVSDAEEYEYSGVIDFDVL